jgi:hypothetical protein
MIPPSRRRSRRLLPLLPLLAALAPLVAAVAAGGGPAPAGREALYAGVWRGGAGTARTLPASPWPELERRDGGFVAQGLRLASVAAYYDRATETAMYTGIWRGGQGSGEQRMRPAMAWPLFVAQHAAFVKEGLRLAAFTAFDRNGQTAYFGVWRSGLGDGAQWLFEAKPWDELVDEDRKLAVQGLRLMALAATRDRDGQLVYAGVWQAGSGVERLEPGLDRDDFAARNKVYRGQKLELAALATYAGNDGRPRYVGVWREGLAASVERIAPAVRWPDFAAADERSARDGLHLFAIAVVQEGGGTR